MSAIHQFVAGFSSGDAISNEALVLRDTFRRWGYASEIFCEPARILPALRKEARTLDSLDRHALDPADVVLLHLSIGSPLNARFVGLPCRRAILYHNVTPDPWFRVINPETAALLASGREQVAALAGAADVTLADSAYNAGELTALGYRDVEVLPLVLDLDRLHDAPDRAVMRRFGDGRTTMLFVGRCAPNKRIEDLLTFAAHYTHTVDRTARLVLVGSVAGVEPYHTMLLARCRELGLEDVCFTGSISQAVLNAHYRCAHLFVSMSEHEGFGIPLLEAMACGVPVMAHDAGAVSETMDGAGVLFGAKDYPTLVELAARIVQAGPLRHGILKAQEARVARYRARDLAAELRRHLEPVLPPLEPS